MNSDFTVDELAIMRHALRAYFTNNGGRMNNDEFAHLCGVFGHVHSELESEFESEEPNPLAGAFGPSAQQFEVKQSPIGGNLNDLIASQQQMTQEKFEIYQKEVTEKDYLNLKDINS